jgi:cell division transport system permease protein
MIYFIQEGFKGIRKHGFMFLISVGVIAACLVLTGSFTLVGINLDYNLNNLLMDENEFIAYIDPELDEEQGKALGEKLSKVANIVDYQYISSEEAMEKFKASRSENQELYDNLPSDMLQARYSIHVQDIGLMEETTQQVEELEEITDITASLTVAKMLASTKRVTVTLASFLLVILLLVSLFIISNTIRMAMESREEEIAVMKIVGATNGFVRAPFLVEGCMMGLCSGLVAFALEWVFYAAILRILENYQFNELFYTVPFQQLWGPVLFCYVAGSLLIGVCSSMIAIRRLLKV